MLDSTEEISEEILSPVKLLNHNCPLIEKDCENKFSLFIKKRVQQINNL